MTVWHGPLLRTVGLSVTWMRFHYRRAIADMPLGVAPGSQSEHHIVRAWIGITLFVTDSACLREYARPAPVPVEWDCSADGPDQLCLADFLAHPNKQITVET